jgi:hypothetical protein
MASYVLAAVCLLVLAATGAEARHPRLVPAVFVFGDSTVDVGNNNDLNVTVGARANYPKYGVDFPGSVPTGRFSNGLNTADFLGRLRAARNTRAPAELSLSNTIRVPYSRDLNTSHDFMMMKQLGGLGLRRAHRLTCL